MKLSLFKHFALAAAICSFTALSAVSDAVIAKETIGDKAELEVAIVTPTGAQPGTRFRVAIVNVLTGKTVACTLCGPGEIFVKRFVIDNVSGPDNEFVALMELLGGGSIVPAVGDLGSIQVSLTRKPRENHRINCNPFSKQPTPGFFIPLPHEKCASIQTAIPWQIAFTPALFNLATIFFQIEDGIAANFTPIFITAPA